MTNNHVLADPAEAARGYVEMNFQAGLDGRALQPVAFALEPDAFFATDRALDFTIVAVAERSDSGAELADFGWLRLIEQAGKVLLGELLNIIQHPNAEPKQLALRENRLTDRLPLMLHYETDTAPGLLRLAGVQRPVGGRGSPPLRRSGDGQRRELAVHRRDDLDSGHGRGARALGGERGRAGQRRAAGALASSSSPAPRPS